MFRVGFEAFSSAGILSRRDNVSLRRQSFSVPRWHSPFYLSRDPPSPADVRAFVSYSEVDAQRCFASVRDVPMLLWLLATPSYDGLVGRRDDLGLGIRSGIRSRRRSVFCHLRCLGCCRNFVIDVLITQAACHWLCRHSSYALVSLSFHRVAVSRRKDTSTSRAAPTSVPSRTSSSAASRSGPTCPSPCPSTASPPPFRRTSIIAGRSSSWGPS